MQAFFGMGYKAMEEMKDKILAFFKAISPEAYHIEDAAYTFGHEKGLKSWKPLWEMWKRLPKRAY